jgi:hypothetical protein
MEPPEELLGGVWYDRGVYDEQLVDTLQERLLAKVTAIVRLAS